MLVGEELAGAPETGLDLVHHEQRVVLGRDLPQPAQESFGRDHDPGLALDRLDQDRGDIVVHRRFDRIGIAVRQDREIPA